MRNRTAKCTLAPCGSGLLTGTLLLFDLGYFGFEWLDELTTDKHRYVCRLREKTSYTVVHTLYESEEVFDGLVWLGTHQAKARYVVRLVRVRVGCYTHEYLTNVLDPTVLPVSEVVRLYARRWDIELAFLLLKEYLHLHLWSLSQTLFPSRQSSSFDHAKTPLVLEA